MQIKINNYPYPLEIKDLTFIEDTSIDINLHGIKYTICGHLEINIDDFWDVDLLTDLYDLRVEYKNKQYLYDDFFQQYDEFTKWYKNYKQLDTLIKEQIQNAYIDFNN